MAASWSAAVFRISSSSSAFLMTFIRSICSVASTNFAPGRWLLTYSKKFIGM